MSVQRGNFVSGGQINNVIYQEGVQSTNLDQIDEAISLLEDIKKVLQSPNRQEKVKFWERFQKEGLKIFSDTFSATIAALFVKAIG